MQSTDEFIHSQNVANFKRRLNVELDQDKRTVLLTLLAEEEAKLRKSKKNGRRFNQDRFA
jgi:hypothetical protein